MEETVNDPNHMKELLKEYMRLTADERRKMMRELLIHCLEPVVEPRFVCKCTKCGAEYQVMYKECQECGSTELREPDLDQVKDLLEFGWGIYE